MNRGKKLFSASVLTVLAACAAYDDDFDDYAFDTNGAYAVPVTENDKPGKTVDELLNMTPHPVHEIDTVVVSQTEKPAAAPDVVKKGNDTKTGRFGSKEKNSLRKGLNAPIDDISYTGTSVVEIEIVRPLILKKAPPVPDENVAEKDGGTDDKVSEAQERAVLDEIVASQGVAAVGNDDGQTAPQTVVVAAVTLSAPVLQDEKDKVSPPAQSAFKPLVGEKTLVGREEIVLKDPSLKKQTPTREKIVLKQPDLPAFDETNGVGVSLPLSLIVFSDGKNALTREHDTLTEEAAEQWKSQPFSRIRVIGYDAGSRQKAQDRAKKIAQMLVKKGVPSSRVVTQTVTGQKPYGAQTGACAELFLEY